ncbi:hypothetical protein AHF37_06031, partial [Paragonimus kellicotti]
IIKPLFPFTENVSEDDADDVELEGPELFSPPRDDAAMTLQGHKESVFCVTIDPTGTYLVSGGQDHVAIVWNLQTGEIMFTTEKLEDSVVCVAFSSDGNFLAVGDMAGGVRVWLRPEDGRSWTLLRSESVADLSWLIWWQPTTIATRTKSSSAVLAAGDADGLITVWSVTATSRPSAGDDKRSKYLSSGINVAATSAIYYLPSIQTDRPKLLVLYNNSELRLWDLKTEQSLASLQLVPANGSSSDLTPSDPQVFCMTCPQLHSSYERATHDRDLLANSLAVGLTCLRWSSTMPIFFTAASNGAVVSWPGVCGLTETDMTGFTRAPEPLAIFWGHRAMVLDLALAPSSSGHSGSSTEDTLVEPFIASASDDSTIRVFSLKSLRMSATR